MKYSHAMFSKKQTNLLTQNLLTNEKKFNPPFVAILFMALLFVAPGCDTDFAQEPLTPSDVNSNDGLSRANHPVRRAYRDNFDTWYNFVPDFAGGWNPMNPAPFPAWYPGGGDGNATHLGNAKTFFNQYVTFIFPNVVSLHAPVTMLFAAELAAAGYTGIPDEVGSIVYDNKGNSIWFHENGITSVPVSPTRVEFSGSSLIIGGTGKFEGATGEVAISGYFNPQDQQDAGYGQEGWIEY
ncbi:MAG: hypothetical protein M3R25_10845 [Bacteroidota bacterium]|nr:hypothetical protein [Bacteroidota bacterium]